MQSLQPVERQAARKQRQLQIFQLIKQVSTSLTGLPASAARLDHFLQSQERVDRTERRAAAHRRCAARLLRQLLREIS